MAQAHSWLLAARPKTLAATIAPIFVGAAVAQINASQYQKHISLLHVIFALFSLIFIQIGTNFFNDALDHKKGADTEDRLGPIRVTQSGLLTSKQVFLAGFFCFLIAILFGIPLVLHSGFPILILGIVSLIFGYAYTGGPYPLAYKGLGEIFVILFFGFAAVCGMNYLLIKSIDLNSLVASAQIGLLAAVLISINNFRDYQGDRRANKMTLAARFGERFARVEIIFFFAFAYLLNLYWMEKGFWIAGTLPMITLPLAIKVSLGILRNEPSPLFNQFLGMAAGVELLFGCLLSIGLLFS